MKWLFTITVNCLSVLLVVFFVSPVIACAQEKTGENKYRGINVVLTKVKPKLGPTGEFLGVDSDEVLQSFVLGSGEDPSGSAILTKSFEQTLLAKEFFRLRLENHTATDWFVYANVKSPDDTCNSILPRKRF